MIYVKKIYSLANFDQEMLGYFYKLHHKNIDRDYVCQKNLVFGKL